MFSKLKTIIYVIAFLLGLALASSASAAITIRPMLNTGLVGYWSMDEGYGAIANDLSGNGNNFTLVGMNPSTDWVDGKMGKSVKFSGSDHASTTPNSALNLTSSMTLSLWIYPKQNLNYYTRLVDKYFLSSYYIGGDEGTNDLGFWLQNTRVASTSANLVTTNSWQLITVTYDRNSGDAIIYRNGINVGSGNYQGTITGNNNKLILGKRNESDSYYYNGYMDEVRIYNRALSAGEVTRLYNLTKPKVLSASDNGLVGYWSFDEGMGTKAGDMSGNGKNGTITGSTWTTGKRGQALSLNGSSDYVDAGNVYNGVKTISFWLKADTTTSRVINFNSTAKVELSGGTIITSDITSPTIYVDGVENSTVDTNWHLVTIKTDSGINASAAKLGQGDAWACGDTLTYNSDNYTTVQMTPTYGSQCWLGENLRTTKKPDGVTDLTSVCDPEGCSSPWGRLYSWTTMMNGSTTATGCGAKIQGICPSGWHVPSDYTSCSNDDFPSLGTDGGALKQTGITEWNSPNTGATNASNWTGYAAGIYLFSTFMGRQTGGSFWSSLEYDASNACSRGLAFDSATFEHLCEGNAKFYAISVRCVKDEVPKPYFQGKLDEVRIYNRALSATEVAGLYTASKKIIKVNAPQNTKLTTGLVGMWTFNGQDMINGTTARDVTGNGYTAGFLNGAKLTSGRVGQGVALDANNDVIMASTTSIGEGSAITVSAWVRFNNPTNNTTKDLMSKFKSGVGQAQWLLFKNRNNATGALTFGVWNSSDVSDAAVSDDPWPTDTDWHHAVGVFDGAKIYVYGDGVSLDSTPPSLTGPIKSYGNYVCLGGEWTGATCNNGGNPIDGDLDEVRIYSRALSSAEIKRLYQMGK